MENILLGTLITRCISPSDFIKQLYQTDLNLKDCLTFFVLVILVYLKYISRKKCISHFYFKRYQNFYFVVFKNIL